MLDLKLFYYICRETFLQLDWKVFEKKNNKIQKIISG